MAGICAGMLRHSQSVSQHAATLYSLTVHCTRKASGEHLPKQSSVHTITITYRIKSALVPHGILRFEHNSLPGQWWCSWKVTFVAALHLHILPNGHQALFPKAQRPGRETDHSTQSSVQVKNA